MKLFESRAEKLVHFGWQHGRYADYWSIVHFFTGIILGTTSSLLHIPIVASVVIIAVIATVYEGLEILSKVAEDVENVTTDIILVILGAALALLSYDYFNIHSQVQALLYAIAISITLILIQYGWKNFLRDESKRKNSYKFLKLALYIVTIIGINLAIGAFFYSTSEIAY